MGNIHFGVNPLKALTLREEYGLRVFVETGLYKGGTVTWAVRHFPHVYSIEKDHDRLLKTSLGIDAGGIANLTLIEGDSRTALAALLDKLNEPCLIWLDAHWCGGSAEAAFDQRDECPLREELAAIQASTFADMHVLMIDDARLFTAPPPYPHHADQWPTYPEIARLLNGSHQTYIEDDVIYAQPR